MMVCWDCGKVFPDSDVKFEEWDEAREYWGATVYEHFAELRCPFCNSGDVEEDYVESEEENDKEETFG